MRKAQFDKYKLLGLNSAYYRRVQGILQSRLAEMVISRRHMSRIETADCAVSLEVVFDINPIKVSDFRVYSLFDESEVFCFLGEVSRMIEVII